MTTRLPNVKRLDRMRRHASGDQCECADCAGRLKVYTTIPNPAENVRTQYLWCNACRWKPIDNKVIVPLE